MGLKNIKKRFSTLPGIEHGSALNKNEGPKQPVKIKPIEPMEMPDIKPRVPKTGGQRRVDPKVNKPKQPGLPFLGGLVGNVLGNKLTQKLGVGQGGSTTGGKILDAVGGPLVGIGRKLFGKK
tara:strand:- start:2639 stop:3004 length:366 start_codon:yes stop_codon:yes gene_type:complete